MLDNRLELLVPLVSMGSDESISELQKEQLTALARKALKITVDWMQGNQVPTPIIRLVEDTFFLRTLLEMDPERFSPLGSEGYDTEIISCVSRLSWNMEKALDTSLRF